MNNGVQGYVHFLGFAPNPKNTFSVIQIGEHVAQFRDRQWYASQNIFLLQPKLTETITNHHFVTASINKSLEFFSGAYNNYPTLGTLTNLIIQLPQTSDGKIDFVFMENFIRELEEERIRELAAYLTVSGYSSYELLPAEQKALKMFEKWEWKEYNLEKLFGKSTRGKRLKSADRIDGNLPFITAGEAETGISAYIGNIVEIFSKNTTTIDMFGSAKYRNYKYGADDHVAVVHTEKLNKHAAIFVTSAIHKSSYTGKFNYGNNFYAKDADKLNIQLPVAPDGNPDYEAMETLISAVQKLVIKDVVLYADRKIAAAKKATGRNIRRDKITED